MNNKIYNNEMMKIRMLTGTETVALLIFNTKSRITWIYKKYKYVAYI